MQREKKKKLSKGLLWHPTEEQKSKKKKKQFTPLLSAALEKWARNGKGRAQQKRDWEDEYSKTLIERKRNPGTQKNAWTSPEEKTSGKTGCEPSDT